jgi:hypothetical protein
MQPNEWKSAFVEQKKIFKKLRDAGVISRQSSRRSGSLVINN